MAKKTRDLQEPHYIFESSWEVCNKVGGIYTVLSTRAKTLQDKLTDKVFFIGPDFWEGKKNKIRYDVQVMSFQGKQDFIGKVAKECATE